MSYKNPTWLREKYCAEKLSLREIAKIAGSDNATIRYWMVKHKIPRRNVKLALSMAMRKRVKIRISDEELRKKYWEMKLSLKQIASEYGVSAMTILARMREYGIETDRDRGPNAPISKDTYVLHECKLIKGQCTDLEIGYIAGVFDGEGSTGILYSKKGKYDHLYPYFNVSNTSEELIGKLHKMIGGNVSDDIYRPPRKKQYTLRFSSIRDVLEVLKKIEPYLIVKRKVARLVIEFCESRLNQKESRTYTEREWEIHRETKKLNKRGR